VYYVQQAQAAASHAVAARLQAEAKAKATTTAAERYDALFVDSKLSLRCELHMCTTRVCISTAAVLYISHGLLALDL
jgi:hypothetical protein